MVEREGFDYPIQHCFFNRLDGLLRKINQIRVSETSDAQRQQLLGLIKKMFHVKHQAGLALSGYHLITRFALD